MAELLPLPPHAVEVDPMQDGRPPLTWHFEEVKGAQALPLPANPRRRLKICTSTRDRLICSNGRQLLWVSPETGAHGLLVTTDFEHSVASIHPGTGEIIVRNAGVHPRSIVRIDALTGHMTEVALPADGLQNLHTVGFSPDGRESLSLELSRQCGILRRLDGGAEGRVLQQLRPQWLESYVPGMAFNSRGSYVTSNSCIFFWPFGGHEREAACLAGSAAEDGEADGAGPHARFRELKKPEVSEQFLIIRCGSAARGPASRVVRMDLRTTEVLTVRAQSRLSADVLGNPPGAFTWCLCGEDVFVLLPGTGSAKNGSEGTCDTVRLLRASVHGDSRLAARLAHDVRTVDLAEPLRSVAFRLASGEVLHFDQRLLVARSSYFHRMFSSGCRETTLGEVDLTRDPAVDRPTLEDLLRFVSSDALQPEERGMERLLRLRALADQYQLPRLVALAEARLCGLLSDANVLQLLGHVLGSDGELERSCWELLDERGQEVLEGSEDSLQTLIQENPVLAQSLLLRFAKRRRRE